MWQSFLPAYANHRALESESADLAQDYVRTLGPHVKILGHFFFSLCTSFCPSVKEVHTAGCAAANMATVTLRQAQ